MANSSSKRAISHYFDGSPLTGRSNSFLSLLHLFELTGDPSESHTMVFNGDFVDRGSWSTEVVLLLFAFKWLYPKNVFLNRGNHETADM